MRKYNVNEINLKVESVDSFILNEHIDGVVISWSSDIGFGEYTITSSPSKSNPKEKVWLVESERMDNNKDKEFGKKLLALWPDQALVIE